MARCSDLRRGYKVNPLGAKVPVKAADGQPTPGIRRLPPLKYFPPENSRKRSRTKDEILDVVIRRALHP
jgi:hypothetical protein